MPKLQIITNVPADVRLLSIEAEIRTSQYAVGGQELLYRTDQGDVYVPMVVGEIFAKSILAHNIRTNDPVRILKAAADIGGGRKAIRWSLTPLTSAGEQSNGSLAVPRMAPQAAPVLAKAAPQRPQWAENLLHTTQLLTDVYAAALAHASAAHGNSIKPEDVRALMTTAFINISKSAGVNSNAA